MPDPDAAGIGGIGPRERRGYDLRGTRARCLWGGLGCIRNRNGGRVVRTGRGGCHVRRRNAVLCPSARIGQQPARFLATSGRGRVAFLGGSITCAPGWRVWTSRAIQERFPDTQFEFINAGIGGTNSTFGAFRLGRDVLGDGPVDLLFVEFAVNDSYERGPDNRRARAMEGIVRQVRRLNPKTDLVFVYLLDKPKFETLNAGEVPEPIQDHESVARHYDIPRVDLASVVAAGLNAGEYLWEDLFGDACHTKSRGGEVYGAFVREFLDAAWSEQAVRAGGLRRMRCPNRSMGPTTNRLGLWTSARPGSSRDGAGFDFGTRRRRSTTAARWTCWPRKRPGRRWNSSSKERFAESPRFRAWTRASIECSVDGGPPNEVDLMTRFFGAGPLARVSSVGRGAGTGPAYATESL